MALNTNGWDYIYTTQIQKLNKLIEVVIASLEKLVDENIEGSGDVSVAGTTTTITIKATELKVTKFSVLNTSNYPTLDVSMTLKGKNNNIPFIGLELNIAINLNWLNKGSTNILVTNTEIILDTIPKTPPSTGLTGNDLKVFCNVFSMYINEHAAPANTIFTSPTDRKYGKYYNFFAGLNTFKNTHPWMEPTIQRFSVKKDVHKDVSDTSCLFSFSCMVKEKPNNDVGYVDINAIPALATSALVIERSVFGEYMVKAAFRKKIDPAPPNPLPTFVGLLFDNSDTVLAKAGTYAFSNNVDIPLKSKDYKNGSGAPVGGTVPKERMLLSIEESNIKLAMGDVGYTFDSLNKPTINQEYVFDLKWQADSTDITKSKIVASGKEKLFIISNDFKKDTASENLLNWLFPAIRYGLVEPIVKSVADRLFRDLNEKGFIRIEKKKLK